MMCGHGGVREKRHLDERVDFVIYEQMNEQ